jgi:DNA invertase Pin-like site-specific DNA recombinase
MVRAPKAAAVYCRISADKRGEGLGVARQEGLCRRLAGEKGWPVAEVYVDNDVSAYTRRPRPAFNRMLADLEAGRRDAVICVDQDRLTRRPVELEGFIDLAERLGVGLANVSGEIDLSTADGRLRARLLGVVARQESEKKSERVTREAEQAARRGVPRGSQRPFGWQQDKTTLNPAEAGLVREAVGRVLAGETVPAVAADWNRRGIRTPQGARYGWAGATLKAILRSPRLCGLRTYRGQVVADGRWEAIVDRQTWETLQARLPKGSPPGRPGGRLLTGVARCGRCGGPLWSSWRKDKDHRTARYACVRRPGAPGCGNLTATGEPLDALVRDAVLHALSGPGLARARRQLAGDDTQQRQAVRDLAEAEARQDEAAALFAEGRISRKEWFLVRDRVGQRIQGARRILDRTAGPLADLPSSAEALREAWEQGTVAWRRALIGTVVDRIVVGPSPHSNRFDPGRVSIDWRV